MPKLQSVLILRKANAAYGFHVGALVMEDAVYSLVVYLPFDEQSTHDLSYGCTRVTASKLANCQDKATPLPVGSHTMCSQTKNR